MEDPREYANWLEWSRSPADEQPEAKTPSQYRSRALRALYADICARLNAQDAEIAALKAEVERLQGLISQFAKASEKLGVALGVDDYTDDDVRLMTYRYGLAIDALVAEAAPSGGEG